MDVGSIILTVLGLVVAVIFLIVFFVVISFVNIWIQARMTGAPVSFLTLLSMRLRRVPIGLVVQSRITAVKAGLPLTTDQLEAHYLAGGDVNQVVRALIAAEKANLNLGFNQAAAMNWRHTSPARACSKRS